MSVLSHSFRSLFLGNCLPSRESRQPVSAQPPCINLSVKSSRSKLKLCESVSGPGLSHQTIQVHHVHTLYATVSCKTIYYTVIIWYMVWIIFHHSARIRILEYLRQLLHLLHRRFLRFGHGLQMGFISNILLIHWNFMSLNKYERIALVILVCFWRGRNSFQRSLKDKGKKFQPKRQGLLNDILGLVGFQALVWSFLGISKGIRSSHVWSIHLGLPTAAVVTCISSRRPEGQDKYLRKMFDLRWLRTQTKQSTKPSTFTSSHLGYYVPAYIYLLLLEEIQNWGSE